MLACREDAESPTAPSLEPNAATEASAPLLFRQLSAGGAHVCGVTTEDKAYCWGNNNAGQLGVGSAAGSGYYVTPIPVAGVRSFRSVSAGTNHTCGVTTGDVLFCWGLNDRGQLGDGTKIDRKRPVRVLTGLRIRQVDAGTLHSCAVTVGDIAYCWGEGRYGELGNGTRISSLAPVRVINRHFTMVSVGYGFSCGVTPTNRGFCWGDDSYGLLGDGSPITSPRTTPVPIAGGLLFREVQAGSNHICGVTTDNQAFCWGNTFYGATGSLPETEHQPTPKLVSGGLAFRSLEAAYYRTCGLTTNDAAYCWGVGVLGPGTLGVSETPTLMPGGLQLRQVTTGRKYTCGVTTNSRGYCWVNGLDPGPIPEP
jgi:alpha-tubulin suppressor-like RCC1 family protein